MERIGHRISAFQGALMSRPPAPVKGVFQRQNGSENCYARFRLDGACRRRKSGFRRVSDRHRIAESALVGEFNHQWIRASVAIDLF